MTPRRPPTAEDGESAEAEAGITQLEGYLLWQAELTGARAEAEAFARQLPWLTRGQHEELVRRYAEARIALSRRVLRSVAHRCAELRTEYAERYALLRRRLLWACALAVLLSAPALGGGVALLATAHGP